ncbi:MAG: hypothetical protein K6L81_13045 [Agarilytica sp.]
MRILKSFSANGLRSGVIASGLLLATLSSPHVIAKSDCTASASATSQKSSSKRRRLGQENNTTTDCTTPASVPQNTEQTKPKRKSKQFSSAKTPQRKKNKASTLPRPKLEDYVASVPIPDRWRIVDSLGYKDRWFDPYNRNVLKGDKPVFAKDWFFNLGVISDSVYEAREIPTPVGASSTIDPERIDVFGSNKQTILNQNLATEFVLYKGDTVFRPPDYEFRITPVFNVNRVELDEVQGVNVDPARGENRSDNHVGLQAAFADIHLRNVSDRYDFDSLRVGIQPFSSDFRGFLFQDNQLGIRLFGTRDNNIFQYNLAFFQRLEKDTNSGLNDISEPVRDDYVFTANLYWQDLFVKGFFSQFSITHNINDEDGEFYFDNNGFIARPASLGREVPRSYDVTYLGYSGDGHFGRTNLTTSLYYAFGSIEPGVFVTEDVDISALFFASELSMDFDWIRPRLSFLYASGDDDPFDNKATGFDAIFENPQFAGSDTSYWIRQNTPLVGGGRVALSSRNGVLNSLRSSKEQGQSNFTNPGTILFGLGVDMDVTPTLRVSANVNQLYFDTTEVLEVARNQGDIDKNIGQDLSLSLTYRPMMSQNVVVRASYARMLAGDGYDDLFEKEDSDYLLLNVILSY